MRMRCSIDALCGQLGGRGWCATEVAVAMAITAVLLVLLFYGKRSITAPLVNFDMLLALLHVQLLLTQMGYL